MIKTEAKKAGNLKEKMRGLIGQNKPFALLLRTRFGIHTFGVKFPIDVLILDRDNKVVAMKESLMPNRIYLWRPKYSNVLELPAGTIGEKKIRIKDEIHILPST